MKKIKSLLNNENGNMMVMLAISIVALFGAVSLVIDVGRLYHVKSVLQNSADAAVLAGAQGLVSGTSINVKGIAQNIANENDKTIEKMLETKSITVTCEKKVNIRDDSCGENTKFVKVSRETTVPMTFAKVLGIPEAGVHASAKAAVRSEGKEDTGKGVAPIAIEKDRLPGGPKFTEETPLKCQEDATGNGKCSPGNWGFLDLEGRGSDGVKEALLNGSSEPVYKGDLVLTKTGLNWGKVREAFFTLKSSGTTGKCSDYTTADLSCDRVITVVIIPSWDDTNGKSEVQVIGYAAYWIDHVPESNSEEKKITGRFISWVTPSVKGGSNPSTLYDVKLVE